MCILTVIFVVLFVSTVTGSDSEVHSDDIVAKINNGQSQWKAAPNEVTKNGIAYMKKLLGTKLPRYRTILNLTAIDAIVKSIPDSFDARTQWPHCPTISSIKDQGNCGSCWAIAVATTASDRLCISSDGAKKINLSIQDLLSCCSTCTEQGSQGCDGGYPNKAWEYVKTTGIVTGGGYSSNEGCYPYEIRPTGSSNSKENYYTPPCKNYCSNIHYRHPFYSDKNYGKSYYLLPQSESVIQSEIMNNGPVVAAFMVYFDFYFYKSGVYKRTSTLAMGGHGVKLIGWGVEKGVKYWLVANSWGESWGENGFFKIKRGTNECYIESYTTGGLMKN